MATESAIGRGSVLAGRYELLDLLDQGSANARFWRACDLVLQRDVALHVIEAGDDRTPSLMAAARASASVAGLHLLRVLDAAVEDDIAYVVAEWGRGVSLDRLVIEHPLPARKAAWMVREVADALVDTHRAGLGHGRLIPENVLVNDNGAVKLIGFAVDKVLHNQSRSAEQDLAADVDALAGLLYAGLTGAWPSGSSAVPAATREHGKVLRPRRTRAGVPRELDVLCDAMLNRPDAPGTPATAMEVRAALSDFLGEAAALPAVDRAALVEENTVAIDMSGLNLDDPDDGTIPTQAASPGPIPEQTSGSPESTVLPAVPLLRTQGPTSSRNPPHESHEHGRLRTTKNTRSSPGPMPRPRTARPPDRKRWLCCASSASSQPDWCSWPLWSSPSTWGATATTIRPVPWTRPPRRIRR
ncbi:MAG: protein kinase [Nocardioidaceae bacterium]|nr:MAG: protein kinase [Nocardioidaceae bacterium]